jgi:uncharacterized protein YecE (DUF72 family)
MAAETKYVIGTCGYSFADWVGTFYPEGTQTAEMFAAYVTHFPAVELNFTFYATPSERALTALAGRSPAGFGFWVKANRQITHEYKADVAGEFVERLGPLSTAGKLLGVLLQFPQSFHRTIDARRGLGTVLEKMAAAPLAVEFRHRSWDHPDVYAGLRARNVTLVVPDVPRLAGLFAPPPMLTTRTGYLRPHSRNAANWYATGAAVPPPRSAAAGAGGKDRYDYDYSLDELKELRRQWQEVDADADKVYVFFNNCHRGQAGRNAEAFRRIVDGL